jgi:hypothetical protein
MAFDHHDRAVVATLTVATAAAATAPTAAASTAVAVFAVTLTVACCRTTGAGTAIRAGPVAISVEVIGVIVVAANLFNFPADMGR